MEADRRSGEEHEAERGRGGEEVWERRAREEADEAAREAARIGGPGPPEPVDEAEAPLAEAGGGEAEGFEQAERDLIEHASHGDPAPDPTEAGFGPEAEEEEAGERGAADHEHSSERRDDRRLG